MRARESLMLCAAEYLAAMGYPHQPFTVVVCQGADRHRLTVPAWPEAPPARPDGAGWRMFSDEEQAIVESLRASGPTTREELAGRLGVPLTTEMSVTLRGLKKRGVIELSPRDGVRLLE